ncbi:complex I assembly factor TIMMDC1, mitochondrial isoform X2 [Dermacentor andersoni]|uniref:complex I assembly factor TIMMDC1, mitochondrial isoform X2 n=1 Tax=Dermacentor andersoni TaxID=34620 RepID=UPI003B3ACC96
MPGLLGTTTYARTKELPSSTLSRQRWVYQQCTFPRELQDAMFLAFGKGAWKLGWRMMVFSTIYMSVAVAGFTYRNKFGVAEHVAAGTLAGFVYKLNMGVRGSLVGAGLGSLLGLVSGATLSVATKAMGITVPEFRYWQHDYWMKEYSEKKALWQKEQAAKGSNAS